MGLGQNKGLDLDVLFLLLLQSTTADASQQEEKLKEYMEIDKKLILKIAKKLKEYMEADEQARELKKQIREEEKEEISNQKRGEEGQKDEEKEQKQQQRENEMRKDRKEGRMKKEVEKGGEKENGEDDDNDEDDDDDDGDKNDNEEEEDDDADDEDDEEGGGPIYIHEDQYAQILWEVFQKTRNIKQLQADQQDKLATKQPTETKTITLDEERIKQMIHEAQQEVLRKLQKDKPDENQATGDPDVLGQNQKLKDDFEEIALKIEKIKQKIKEQLKINSIMDKIKRYLENDCPLILLQVGEMMDGSRWEEIRQALSQLNSADAVIFTTTESIQQAKGYCYPPREPIDYSLVGLYHDTVLELTSQQKYEDNYNPQIFRSILEECVPHEFCMKIFTHTLYAKPKSRNEKLINLYNTLKASPKSFDIITKKMLMYSYNDMPKVYKSCLLYLAIFPKGKKIRRSTLIERWLVEDWPLKEDWPSSVSQANQCFDVLIQRWLVYPADIGATGKVNSCVIGDIVQGFITTIARKQHFVETRLSHHLARHFSIFNDLQLRRSDTIDKFFQGLSKSSRVSQLKVLDLEGCQCFGGKNQRYVKDICSKMLLLKYLSLRGTDITQLPSEINHLRDLEVLDIRQTKLPEYATASILLLKLKCLLAGRIDQSPSNVSTIPSPRNCQFWKSFRKNIDPNPSNFGTSVRIPYRIDKMEEIEVLSNVKAQHSNDLKDIGKLWKLRKLGVVIKDKDQHLSLLLQTISDLHECLCSLSITTLPEATSHEGTPSSVELPYSIASRLQNHPKILESLSIIGTTLTGHLPVITRGGNNKLAKVTLSSTPLNQDDLKILSMLPNLLCLRLRHVACAEGMLTFRHDEFTCLKYLLIEGSDLTNITFEVGSALELEKMVLSFTSPVSISGVQWLPKLEELELNNKFCGMLLSSFDNAEQISKVTLCGTLLKQDALQILAKKPNICCLVLLDKSFDDYQITFQKDDFPWLNRLVVDCSSITEIIFTKRSAPRLEKIITSSFTYLSGIDNLPRLMELEFNSGLVPPEVKL